MSEPFHAHVCTNRRCEIIEWCDKLPCPDGMERECEECRRHKEIGERVAAKQRKAEAAADFRRLHPE